MGHKQSEGTGGFDMSRVSEISHVVEVQDTTRHALGIMDTSGLDFLPVVGVERGKLLGVILRQGIERGCSGMSHDLDRCAVQNHLKTGVKFLCEDEPLDPTIVLAAAREPVLVVDRDLRPVGVLRGEEG